MTALQSLSFQKRECRLLPEGAFSEQHHGDAIYSHGVNRSEQTENEPAPCKTEFGPSDHDFRRRAVTATVLAHAIAACHPQDACKVMDAALTDLHVGAPLPSFMFIIDEARSWASWATRRELKAYLLVSFEALPQADQAAFLDYIAGRAAA